MKKSVLLLSLLFVMTAGAYAQDDVYFVPKKSQKKTSATEQVTYSNNSSYDVITPDGTYAYDEDDDWYVGRNRNKDVDSYNRQGDTSDAQVSSVDNYDDVADGQYTERIIRFHSPTTLVVLSPYYWDYYDALWYDPWYSWTWRPYRSWSWYNGWYGGWYGGWYNTWYSPSYYWGWNSWYYPRYNHWYGGWYGHPRHNDFAWNHRTMPNRPSHSGGWGGRRNASYANNGIGRNNHGGIGSNRPSSRYNGGGIGTNRNNGVGNSRNNGGRSFGSADSYNRRGGTTNNNSSRVGNNRSNNTNRNSGSTNSSSRGRSWSGSSSNSSSGSFGTSRSSGSSGRSFGNSSGSGGGRSFGGGGGGRSFGGRR